MTPANRSNANPMIRLLRLLRIPLCILLSGACFIAALYVQGNIGKAYENIRRDSDQIRDHLTSLEQFRSMLAERIAGQQNSTAHIAESFNASKWTHTIELLNQDNRVDSAVESQRLPSHNLPATEIRQLKLHINEIDLALSEFISKQTGDLTTAQKKALAQNCKRAVDLYKSLATPLLTSRLLQQNAIAERLQQRRSLLIMSTVIPILVLAILLTLVFVRSQSQTASQAKKYQAYVAALQHLQSGIVVVNRQLKIEFALLDYLNLGLERKIPPNSSLETLFSNYLEAADLRSWRLALQKQFLTSGLKMDETGDTALTIKVGDHSFQLISRGLPGPNKPQWIVTTWQSLISSAATTEVKATPDEISALTKKFDRRLKLIEQLTHLDTDIAGEFFRDTQQLLQTCRMRLDALANHRHPPALLLNALLQTFHQIKGDAAILGLTDLSQSIHTLEDEALKLPTTKTIDKTLTAPLTKAFTRTQRLFESTSKLFFQFTKPNEQMHDDNHTNRVTYLNQYAQKIARDADKRVKLIVDNLEAMYVAEGKSSQIMTLLSQLLRNAIVHGIEDTPTRKKQHKTAYGCVHISAEKKQDNIIIKVRDDGRGIDVSRVLKKAQSLGRYKPEQRNQLTSQLLLDIITTPGLTTQAQADQHAGRGVGLDLVRNIVKSLNGELFLATKPQSYTEFTIRLPNDDSEHS